jgi:hypothetical protein
MNHSEAVILRRVQLLGEFQRSYTRSPVHDSSVESPANALRSLAEARKKAPASYADYLEEAVAAYEGGLYRAAILMVWAATVEHLYGAVQSEPRGLKKIEESNKSRYGTSSTYRCIKKIDDLRYLKESQFIQLGEDCGMYNRTARAMLSERLDLRNRCGHPTGYKPGREETVIFVESLTLNILSNSMVNWTR